MADPTLDDGRLMFAFAHDLRGYLRTVLTRIQLVQAGGAGTLPEQDRLFLEEAATAGGDMNRLLSAMVSYCEVAPSTERISLNLLLRGVKLETKTALTEAAAELSVAGAENADVLVPKALNTVLKELITNSCRFRRPGTGVRIQVLARMVDSATLEIAVSDDGSGIDPTETEKIFLPFQRMHARSDFPGFGLGLALCRKIISANCGDIGATVPAAGGLSVVMTLPATSIT